MHCSTYFSSGLLLCTLLRASITKYCAFGRRKSFVVLCTSPVQTPSPLHYSVRFGPLPLVHTPSVLLACLHFHTASVSHISCVIAHLHDLRRLTCALLNRCTNRKDHFVQCHQTSVFIVAAWRPQTPLSSSSLFLCIAFPKIPTVAFHVVPSHRKS